MRLVLHNRLRLEYVRQHLVCGFLMTKEVGPVAKELLNFRKHILNGRTRLVLPTSIVASCSMVSSVVMIGFLSFKDSCSRMIDLL